MKCEAHLAGELGEDAVVIVGEGVALLRAFDDDEAKQLAGVTDRGHPQLGGRATVEESRQPDRRQALPETPARVMTGRSRADTTTAAGPLSGTDTARSSTSPTPV